MGRHSPLQQYNEALLMAKENGLRVIQRPGCYLLYRIMKEAPKDAFIGSRGSVEGLRQLVERAARSLS